MAKSNSMSAMNRADFLEKMKLFIEAYGQKAFPSVRLDEIFQTFRLVPLDVFEKILRRCIRETFTPPTVSKMLELGSQITADYNREASFQKQAMRRGESSCEKCNDAGWCLLRPNSGYGLHFCTCDCKSGIDFQVKNPNVQVWCRPMENDFKIVQNCA